MKKILITGGTGLIGRRLSQLLSDNGYEVCLLSRSSGKGKYKTYTWDVRAQEVEAAALKDVYGIIHLAGAGVADKRWTASRKQEILDSRVQSTQLLIKEIAKLDVRPQVFIGASAIGYYGSTGESWVDETTPPGEDFLAKVTEQWEVSSLQLENLGVRRALIRVGIVLSNAGGALPQLTLPIKWGAGAPIGSGKQWMSWIHIDDLCKLFMAALEDEKWEGIYNGVAPNPVTNKALTKAAARIMHRPLWLPNVPSVVLKLALGEMAGMITGGSRISCQKNISQGFQYRYSTIESALGDLLKKDVKKNNV